MPRGPIHESPGTARTLQVAYSGSIHEPACPTTVEQLLVGFGAKTCQGLLSFFPFSCTFVCVSVCCLRVCVGASVPVDAARLRLRPWST